MQHQKCQKTHDEKKIKLFRISFLLPLLALAGCNEQDTKKWFKWHIIAKMIDNQILDKKQIYDCLTCDVRSHGELKDRLIENNPSTAYHIETAFLINLGI